MSDFQAKMHHIQFRLGLRRRSCWGRVYSAAQNPELNLRCLLLRGGEGKEKGEMSDFKATRSSANAEEPCEHTVS